MKRRTLLVLPLVVLLAACLTVSKLVLALDAVVGAATAAEIIDSTNPLVTQYAGLVIDDANQTIALLDAGPVTVAVRQQIEAIWANSIPDPKIKALVGVVVTVVNQFLAQLQTTVPTPTPTARAKPIKVKLTSSDRAKLTEMRAKLTAAKAKLVARGK